MHRLMFRVPSRFAPYLVLGLASACAHDANIGFIYGEPEVDIRIPADGWIAAQGAPLHFEAQIRAESGYDADEMTFDWSSAVSGPLEVQQTLHLIDDKQTDLLVADFTGLLDIGEHKITLTGTAPASGRDDTAPSDSDHVTVQVIENTPPLIAIDSPDPTSQVDVAAPIQVSVSATDAEQENDTLTLQWALDGVPLADAPTTPDLFGQADALVDLISVDTHTLEVTVIDSTGSSVSASISLDAIDPDVDGDGHLVEGFGAGDDCDDTNADVNPEAIEICNEIDDDCDTLIDDVDPDWVPADDEVGWADDDGDGFGDPDAAMEACELETGYVDNDGDCDDSDIDIHPLATEICDPLDTDEDCDGAADDLDLDTDSAGMEVFYPDVDQDLFGANDAGTLFCDLPTGWQMSDGDCDDALTDINPAATEICDLVDNDCDGLIDDEDLSVDDLDPGGQVDGDGDGYGAWRDTVCDPMLIVVTEEDCNDDALNIHPNATEVCDNGIDENCYIGDAECRYDGPYDVEQGNLGNKPLTRIIGEGSEQLGAAIAATRNAQDVTELMAGAPHWDGVETGAAYVWRSRSPGADGLLHTPDDVLFQRDIDLSIQTGNLGNALMFWATGPRSEAGASVALGDIDGLGDTDYIIGAPGADGALDDDAGSVFIFGGEALADGDYPVSDADLVLDGLASSDRMGHALLVTDVNCDDQSDLVVSAKGEDGGEGNNQGVVRVFLGPVDLSAGTLLDTDADYQLNGVEGSDRFGSSLASAGDIDGDGCDDLLIGAEQAGNNHSRGAAYLFYASRFCPDVADPACATGIPIVFAADGADIVLSHPDVLGWAGTSVAGLGDLDGNGRSEIAIGAPKFNDLSINGLSEGRVYVVFNPDAAASPITLGDPAPLGSSMHTITLTGDVSGSYTGSDIAAIGDTDGDGQDEFLVAAHQYDGLTGAQGRVSLYYDGANLTSGQAQALEDAGFLGEGGDWLGSTCRLWDMDGDGRDDFALSTEQPHNGNDGILYVLFGTSE